MGGDLRFCGISVSLLPSYAVAGFLVRTPMLTLVVLPAVLYDLALPTFHQTTTFAAYSATSDQNRSRHVVRKS